MTGAAFTAPPREGPRKSATIEYYGRRLLLLGRCSTWSTSVSSYVAGAALEASQLRIAVAGQHHQHNTINTTSSTQHHLRHHQDNTINTTSSTQHHQHNTNTTPSTQHHQHNIIYDTINTTAITITTTTTTTTTTTRHHPHSTIYTTSSHTGRRSTWSTAILSLLPHSC